MNRYNSKLTMVSLYVISAILALTIIIEAIHITPAIAQTTGSYIEVSRIINIPKSMPNSSSLTGNNGNLTSESGNLTGNNGNLTSESGNLTGAP